MAIDATVFRSTLAQWASGVTVVTVNHGGEYHGMTVSSFSSVSLTPPLILVCIAKKAHTHDALLETGAFGVNILAGSQIEMGKRFAGMLPEITDRFDGLDYTLGETGSPLLPDVLAWMDCRIHQAIDAGDHTVVIGEIINAHASSGEPLLYANRQWGYFTES